MLRIWAGVPLFLEFGRCPISLHCIASLRFVLCNKQSFVDAPWRFLFDFLATLSVLTYLCNSSMKAPATLASVSPNLDNLYSHDTAKLIFFCANTTKDMLLKQNDILLGSGALVLLRAQYLDTVFLKCGTITYPILPSLKCWRVDDRFVFPVPSGGYWRIEVVSADQKPVCELERVLSMLLRFQTGVPFKIRNPAQNKLLGSLGRCKSDYEAYCAREDSSRRPDVQSLIDRFSQQKSPFRKEVRRAQRHVGAPSRLPKQTDPESYSSETREGLPIVVDLDRTAVSPIATSSKLQMGPPESEVAITEQERLRSIKKEFGQIPVHDQLEGQQLEQAQARFDAASHTRLHGTSLSLNESVSPSKPSAADAGERQEQTTALEELVVSSQSSIRLLSSLSIGRRKNLYPEAAAPPLDCAIMSSFQDTTFSWDLLLQQVDNKNRQLRARLEWLTLFADGVAINDVKRTDEETLFLAAKKRAGVALLREVDVTAFSGLDHSMDSAWSVLVDDRMDALLESWREFQVSSALTPLRTLFCRYRKKSL